MSFQAAAWAIKQRPQSATEKLLLIALADCMNGETGRCFPSIAFLANAALCSTRTAQRGIKSLEQQGFISRCFRVNDTPLYKFLDPCQNDTPRQTTTQGRQNDTFRGDTGDTLTRNLTRNNKPGNNLTASVDFIDLHTATDWAEGLNL